jgi:hypothetical protein
MKRSEALGISGVHLNARPKSIVEEIDTAVEHGPEQVRFLL